MEFLKSLMPYLEKLFARSMGAKSPEEVQIDAEKSGNDAVSHKPASGIGGIVGSPKVIK